MPYLPDIDGIIVARKMPHSKICKNGNLQQRVQILEGKQAINLHGIKYK